MEKDEPNVTPDGETNAAADETAERPAAERDGGAAETQPRPPLGPKKRIAAFFKGYGGVIGAAGALLLLAVMVLLAVLLDGDLYDKAAYFWIVAFLAELGFYLLVKRSKGTLVALIVTGTLAAAFVALYGLELGGILP